MTARRSPMVLRRRSGDHGESRGRFSTRRSSCTSGFWGGSLLWTLGLGIAASASAQDAVTLEPKTQNNTTFISGGVGKDEAQLADAISRYGYNVQLVFAEQTGAFLADVNLHITDAAGKTVLDTVSDGPMFLAGLPPGQYRVAAQA